MKKRLISSLAAISLLALVACSNDAASVTTDTAMATTVPNATPNTPTSIADLSESAAAARKDPLPQDLSRSLVTDDEMFVQSANAAGDYVTRSEQIIPADTPVFAWATGLTGGLERITDFTSAGPTPTDVDRTTSRPAVLVQRTLMFASAKDATDSMAAYQRLMGRAVINSAVLESGPNALILNYRNSSQERDEYAEAMLHSGSVITWVLFEDSLPTDWTNVALNVAKIALADTLKAYPSLTD